MNAPSGIGKLDRARITAILRSIQHTVSVEEATKILGMSSNTETAKLLSRWSSKGWFSRIKRGLYVPVPLESISGEPSLEDPLIIAEKLYKPCYVGGWSAAEYWGLTEQIFRTVIVFTTLKQHKQKANIKGTTFLLHKISDNLFFGIKSIWRGQIKVLISDPTRTIIDLLNTPKAGGGTRSVTDIFVSYLNSEHKNLTLLAEYTDQFHNGAIYKRLGFLLEQYTPTEETLIALCKNNLTSGNAKLDPQINENRLVTRWHLWVPKHWNK